MILLAQIVVDLEIWEIISIFNKRLQDRRRGSSQENLCALTAPFGLRFFGSGEICLYYVATLL